MLLGDSLQTGGTEGQFVEVALGLDRRRWDVDVVCLTAQGPLRARLERAGIVPSSCGPDSFRSPRALVRLLALARRLRTRAVRVVHCFDIYSGVLGVPAARLARVPVIIASQRELGDLRGPGGRAAYAAARMLASDVLVNADAVAARLPSRAAAKATVVPNGVDLARFRPGAVARDDGPVVVGTIGNLRSEKRVPDLVRAFARVRARRPEVVLSIWGDGGERSAVRRLVDELQLGDAVRLHGHTPSPERALAGIDVFVLASASEACSNALLEALAAGRAVVATAVGGNPALVERGVTGLLVPPADVDALAAAILSLVEDRALARRLGAAARARAEAERGMGAMVAQIEALYDRALARAGVPPPHPAWAAARVAPTAGGTGTPA